MNTTIVKNFLQIGIENGVSSAIVWFLLILFGIFLQNRFNLINRARKLLARLLNKQVVMDLLFLYEGNNTFSDVKNKIKNVLSSEKCFEVLKESKIRLDISYSVFLLTIIQNQKDEISIELKRSSCGIRDIVSKVENFLAVLDKIAESNMFGKFKSGEINLELPYNWDYISIRSPKGFKIKDYIINLEKNDGFKSNIKIISDKINMPIRTKDEIMPLLQRFL